MFDTSVRFTREFLKSEYENPLRVYFVAENESHAFYHGLGFTPAGMASPYGHVYIFKTTPIPAWNARLLVHEAAHAFLGRIRDFNRTPQVLMEGMAIMVDYAFVDYMRDDFVLYQSALQIYSDFHRGGEGEIPFQILEIYCERSGCTYDLGFLDYFILLDVQAYIEITDETYAEHRWYLASDRRGVFREQYLPDMPTTYRQAGSFMLFLYDKFGMETLLNLYRDENQVFYYVALEWDELIGMWRERIGVLDE